MKRVASVVLIIGAVAAVGYAAVALAEAMRTPTPPIGALVIDCRAPIDKSGIGMASAFRVHEPAKLAALERFFPDYRRRPESGVAGGWIASHEVYFNFPRGETVRAVVSENRDAVFWTTGAGDFDTCGDFKAFVETLKEPALGADPNVSN